MDRREVLQWLAMAPLPALGLSPASLERAAGGQDELAIEYDLSAGERRQIDEVEREVARGLRRLRCVRLRTIRPGHAASVHYAGTLPMSVSGAPLTTDPAGKLAGTRGVYVADGAVFPSLPSKWLTFTMMANANRIGARLARALAP